jgi:maltooligosyltrehalose trehalohydrolase
MRRNRLVIACNLGTAATSVPVSGELVLSWNSPSIGAKATELPGHSSAILRSRA